MAQVIALVVIGDVGQEPLAIRSTLEYFGFRVIYYPVGRPNDFINIINGKVLYKDITDIIICAHGIENAFVMPELAEEIYDTDEPRNNFTAAMITQMGNLPQKIILTTACNVGDYTMANAFLSIGCNYYMGAADDVDGNSALYFVQSYYYQIAKGNTIKAAYSLASGIDQQTACFKLYKNI